MPYRCPLWHVSLYHSLLSRKSLPEYVFCLYPWQRFTSVPLNHSLLLSSSRKPFSFVITYDGAHLQSSCSLPPPVLATSNSNGSRYLHPNRLFRLNMTPSCSSMVISYAKTHEDLPAHKESLWRSGDIYLGTLHPVGFVAGVGCGFRSWLDVVAFISNPHPFFGQC